MDEWMTIRRRVLVEGVSKRQVLRETGMHWTTLEKILAHGEPPGYQRRREPEKPKIGPFLGWIAEVLKADPMAPRKQRHTALKIWQRLRDELGFTGKYTIVKDAVRQLKRRQQEVFLPLVHRPGEAQADFGQALVRMAGALRKVFFFVMALPYSDAFFVMAFERECTESFWEGHVRAFAFFGGVPRRIAYDNTRVAAAKILGSRARSITRGFAQLVSHYLFDYHFCLVRRANEKGVVEGTVKFARLNFFVPVPQVRDFDELNAWLLERCRDDLGRRLRGQTTTKERLLVEDRAAFLPQTADHLDAQLPRRSHQRPVRVRPVGQQPDRPGKPTSNEHERLGRHLVPRPELAPRAGLLRPVERHPEGQRHPRPRPDLHDHRQHHPVVAPDIPRTRPRRVVEVKSGPEDATSPLRRQRVVQHER